MKGLLTGKKEWTMNYYIEGNKDNATKIKEAFEKLGFAKISQCFEYDDYLYFSVGKRIWICKTDSIYANIIKTHPDYQELELPVEPKFKVGDSLQSGCMYAMVRRIDTENQRYICQFDDVIPFEEQELWSLVPNPKPHYDISNFNIGTPVLVRDSDNSEWKYVAFSHYREEGTFCACGSYWYQCIPFNEDTKHLLGTTDMCDERFINW